MRRRRKADEKDAGAVRVWIVYFAGQWIVKIVDQGTLAKFEFEFEQDATAFAECQQLRRKPTV
jgi:hypothetical protein